jgi:hypothetical protein
MSPLSAQILLASIPAIHQPGLCRQIISATSVDLALHMVQFFGESDFKTHLAWKWEWFMGPMRTAITSANTHSTAV